MILLFSDYILKLCPYWDLLDQIFGQRKNINPTEIFDSTLDDTAFEEFIEQEYEFIDETQHYSTDSESSQRPDNNQLDHNKISENDRPRTADIATSSGSFEKFRKQLEKQPKLSNKRRPANSSLAFLSEIQEKKNKLDEKRMERQLLLDAEKVQIEKDKLQFEKDKWKMGSDIKKYEIDKQFELRNFEIQQQNEFQKLQLQQEERLKRYEIELEHKNNSSSSM